VLARTALKLGLYVIVEPSDKDLGHDAYDSMLSLGLG
jgi:hypothetical protein